MPSDAQQASQPFRQRDIAKPVSPRESNPEQLSLRLEGDCAIAQAVDAARAFGQAQRLAGDDLARLCIVVEELIANLYDHGGVTEQDEVQFVLASDPAGIRVSIIDGGLAFNPWSDPIAAENGQGGGAGVRLVRAWAQLIRYQSSDDGNQLELLVPVEAAGRSSD
jgi:serine/threonine-protein kinase RsbW